MVLPLVRLDPALTSLPPMNRVPTSKIFPPRAYPAAAAVGNPGEGALVVSEQIRPVHRLTNERTDL